LAAEKTATSRLPGVGECGQFAVTLETDCPEPEAVCTRTIGLTATTLTVAVLLEAVAPLQALVTRTQKLLVWLSGWVV
jgi:hypothetical protein